MAEKNPPDIWDGKYWYRSNPSEAVNQSLNNVFPEETSRWLFIYQNVKTGGCLFTKNVKTLKLNNENI